MSKFTENDYTFGWGRKFFVNEKDETDFRIHYRYYDLIKANSESDGHELGLQASLPKILEVCGNPLIPSIYYAILDNIDGHNDEGLVDYNGEVVIFGLDYLVPVEKLTLDIFGNLAYRSGFDCGDSEFAYSTFGIKTKIELRENVSLVPFLNLQITMDDSLQGDDDCTELYGGLMCLVKF